MYARKKIRVLECIRQGQIGGGESHLLSLVENLDRSLYEPIVLSFTDGPMIERLKGMNVETHVIHTTRPFDITKWKEVRNFLKEKEIDLVHAHGTRANSNILWAAKQLNIPVIYTVHGWSFHPDQNPITKRIRIIGEKYLTSKADLNISVSNSNQQSGKNFIPSFDSVVIYNGIDQQKFDPKRSFNNVRAELNIPRNATLVLFIARFTSHKQPLALIHSFAEAIKVNPDMHLLMVGDGDQKEEAKKLIETYRLHDKVTFQSFRQDVPDILAAADIFVLPSLWEGLPIGLLEAMAMGKAVIATNVDGTSEIIQNEKNGLLIETDNLVPDLSNALVRLSKDNALRSLFSERAVETVNDRYNAGSMTRKIEGTYNELMKKKYLAN